MIFKTSTVQLWVLLFLFPWTALKASSASGPINASDAELYRQANEELQTKLEIIPDKTPVDTLVNQISVPDLSEKPSDSKLWRLGIGGQSFSFGGQANTGVGERFSLDAAGSTAMVNLEVCRDLSTLRIRSDLWLGNCFRFGFANQNVNLETSKGSALQDVSLRGLLPETAVAFEWRPFGRLPLFLSAEGGVGSYILVQSSPQGLADATTVSGTYSFGSSVRIDLWSYIFLQGSYRFRDLFLEKSNVAIQNHNIVATAGAIF